jgi:hypothetical protein
MESLKESKKKKNRKESKRIEKNRKESSVSYMNNAKINSMTKIQ